MASKSSELILRQNPIRRAKLYEMVAAKIEGMIQSGELRPGDRLPSERDIMVAYNIGRPAVREAFLALEGKGLISIENGRRARVRAPDVHNVLDSLSGVVNLLLADERGLKDLFDARRFIEVAVARNAAVTMSEEELRTLKSSLDDNRKAIGNREQFMATDIAFHGILFEAANNPIFNAVYSVLVSWLMERWRKIKRTKSTETVAYQGHAQIYEAIARRDPDAAEAAMKAHLASAWTLWAQYLNRTDEGPPVGIA